MARWIIGIVLAVGCAAEIAAVTALYNQAASTGSAQFTFTATIILIVATGSAPIAAFFRSGGRRTPFSRQQAADGQLPSSRAGDDTSGPAAAGPAPAPGDPRLS